MDDDRKETEFRHCTALEARVVRRRAQAIMLFRRTIGSSQSNHAHSMRPQLSRHTRLPSEDKLCKTDSSDCYKDTSENEAIPFTTT